MNTFTHRAMDTEFTVSFAAPKDTKGLNGFKGFNGFKGLDEGGEDLYAAAAAAAFARLDELELLLTRFNDTSDVAVIRGLKPGEVAVVARETMEVLTTAATVCAATAGAFDPTVKARNFAALVLDTEHLRVSVKAAPVELDFGGIGKGYALDEMAALLRSEQYGLEHWLLDAGTSTILASGGPWPLGVGGVWKSRTRLPTVLKLSSGALSGSGFEIQGAHIVDPRTGAPAERWAQSWARAPSAAVADALSTAALSLSPDELSAAADTLDAAILVARRQKPFMDRLRDPLKWYGNP